HNVGPGTYTVREHAPAGWTMTAQTGATVVVTSGLESEDNHFANFKNIILGGVKWQDHNANGVRDAGDQGLAGWHILVNGVDIGVVTGADGSYRFEAGPGTYTLQEAQQPGWVETYGTAGYTIVASSGVDVGGNDFGNAHLSSQGGLTLGFWSNKNGQ